MKVLLCAISKDDENYILEWVKYYLSIGITHIIIYNNSKIDNYSNILKEYINHNLVTIDNCVLNKEFINKEKNINSQTFVYTKCYQENYNKYDFICYFDTDEFIEFENKSHNIISFLNNEKFNNYSVIRLCWKLYNDNNIIIPNNFSVTNFTNSVNTSQNRVCKSIIKTDIILQDKKITAHGIYDISACNALGEECWNKNGHDNIYIGDVPILQECWLNHYRYKTISEYINKILKMNKSNLNEYTIDYFFSINEITIDKLEYIKSVGIDYKKYIVFSNDCTSAWYYKEKNIKYNNPIVWDHWPTDNYINFIENFVNVDLGNYKIFEINANEYFHNMANFDKNKNKTYYVSIDNKYNIAYSHYIKANNDVKTSTDIYSPNIKEYILSKYESRLKRYNLYKCLNNAVFLFNEKSWTTIEDELIFINSKTTYKKILYTSYKELLKYNNSNMIIIYNEKIDYEKSWIYFGKILANKILL